jgi:endonuclease-3 related protein
MRRREPQAGDSEDRQEGAGALTLRRGEVGRLYALLRERFGFRNWWPADTPFEVVVGAVLTQQTAWTNVEKAIRNLKAGRRMSLAGICGLRRAELEAMVRPSGYFRQKSKRLQGLCRFIRDRHSTLDGLFALGDAELREALLAQDGIGKETCDSIMLYAAGRPVFVVDAYTKRIVSRVFGVGRELEYDELQGAFQKALRGDVNLYKDMHAQLVELAKQNCRKADPLCGTCPALRMCGYGSRNR